MSVELGKETHLKKMNDIMDYEPLSESVTVEDF
jgi:hypothetical protein